MLLRILHKAEETIIALLLVSMTLLVFTETLMRFAFGAGVMWAQELTLHLSAWLVLFGMSYGLRVGAHIGVDFLVKKLPHNAQHIVTGIMLLAALTYCGLFIYGAYVYLDKMVLIGIELDDLPIQKWQAHSMLLLGFVFLGVRLLEVLIRVIKGKQTRLMMHDEAEESMQLAAELKENKS
ncbi:TRAP transporter small permease [Solemya velum gill symbiont]|uniref:TRAP transporter small permease n=1 Tax=Solemya velum gill symbiont TaxID=2340 RepID=UPI0018A83814|nr:TRAP transporter small permease [Solemya velum gill symbiont]